MGEFVINPGREVTSFRSFTDGRAFVPMQLGPNDRSAQDALNDEAAAKDDDLTGDNSNEAVDTFFDLS